MLTRRMVLNEIITLDQVKKANNLYLVRKLQTITLIIKVRKLKRNKVHQRNLNLAIRCIC
jgi:hypothetical protein